jgi:hypothetical protein
MRPRSSLVLLVPVAILLTLPLLNAQQQNSLVRGWLSDEGCASGRASSGVFTGTNPDCAKKCVREGKRIVLIEPDQKRLLIIVNGDLALGRVGDYVEIKGNVDAQAKTLHIDSIKLIEKGSAMCDAPPKNKPQNQ